MNILVHTCVAIKRNFWYFYICLPTTFYGKNAILYSQNNIMYSFYLFNNSSFISLILDLYSQRKTLFDTEQIRLYYHINEIQTCKRHSSWIFGFYFIKQLWLLFSAYKMFLQISNNTILQNDKFLKVVNILLDLKN